jgi:hypothetical protein
MVEWLLKDELERMWKEAAVGRFASISDFPGETEKNQVVGIPAEM